MKLLAFVTMCVFFVGCGAGPQPVSQDSNAANRPMRSERMQSTIEHSAEKQQPSATNTDTGQPGGKRKWTQSGDPIDTKEFNAAIAAAEKSVKAKPNDAAAKTALAEAFFRRGTALTDARQYASALGDYRRALKFDPNHADSKKWEEQIIGIYEMMNMESPKEGEEPPPLPLKKL